MTRQLPFAPYPSINHHGVTGDRRTAALTAADGTIDWMCLPDYDGASVFGALLDAQRGGYWRIGPHVPINGAQSYIDDSPALVTTWGNEFWELELADLMVWPEEQRSRERGQRRVLVRRLRCTLGKVRCSMHLCPRYDFDTAARATSSEGGVVFQLADDRLGLWTSFPVTVDKEQASATMELRNGDELWAVLALDEDPGDWSCEAAKKAFEETIAYWSEWIGGLSYSGLRARRMQRSGLIIHMLGYAPSGAMVAAPTTSLPEQLGGPRNYDYRFAWIRDASLSVAGLALLGDRQTTTRYMDWLAQLKSETEMPLQVAYHVNGNPDIQQRERHDIEGYRRSLPVRLGNRAFDQIQPGSLGYLCDSILIYLKQGGDWKPKYWDLIERVARYIVKHWNEEDNGIWELPKKAHYVSSKVMSWVVLDRAIQIGQRTGHKEEAHVWVKLRDTIHADVLKKGWSERQQTFVQHYGSEAIDASELLIPVMGFLPAKDERVHATVDRIAEGLTIDGLVYRFQPLESPVEGPSPLGEFEGSFLPCSFWLATAHTLAGRIGDAEEVLRRAEKLTSDVGLFAEEADARSNEMLGNFPLLFSQVEYIRAVFALAAAKSASGDG